LDEVVNKGLLSTGEAGEFVNENMGFDLHLGVEPAPLLNRSSNRRRMRDTRKPLEYCGYERTMRGVLPPTKRAFRVGAARCWLPELQRWDEEAFGENGRPEPAARERRERSFVSAYQLGSAAPPGRGLPNRHGRSETNWVETAD
jgi:hypothetical protein